MPIEQLRTETGQDNDAWDRVCQGEVRGGRSAGMLISHLAIQYNHTNRRSPLRQRLELAQNLGVQGDDT